MKTPQEYAKEIDALRQTIDRARYKINDVAKEAIPDFFFLDHKVSTFWSCDSSPIGMCVFLLDEFGRTTECRYCGDPEERK